MTGAALAALIAAAAAAIAAVVVAGVAASLRRQVRELRSLVEQLNADTAPLLRSAGALVDQAATEMERVTDVLGAAEAVSSTVDSASRLAYRAFANPVVKTVAFGTGLRGALRRLFGRPLPAVAPASGAGRDAPVTSRASAIVAAGAGPLGAAPGHRRATTMMKRVRWLATGVALGAGGSVWARRQLEELRRRSPTGLLAAGAAGVVERGSARVRGAVHAGRAEARRREDEFRERLGADPAPAVDPDPGHAGAVRRRHLAPSPERAGRRADAVAARARRLTSARAPPTDR